jgi:hypothetical protein
MVIGNRLKELLRESKSHSQAEQTRKKQVNT